MVGFMVWTPLTSLPDSNGSAPRLGTAVRINMKIRDQLTVTSNQECARATQLAAKMDMRVSRVQRWAGKKFYLSVAL